LRRRLTTLAVLAVAVGATVLIVAVARTVVADNEERLLRQRADELVLIVSSLGSNLQADVVSATVAAQEADGDTANFARFVTQGDNADPSDTWVLLRRTPFGLAEVTHTGSEPLLDANRDEALNRDLLEAADGGFAIVALGGEAGPLQALGVAAGRPGVAGDYLAFREIPLIQAAAGSDEVNNGFEDVGIALYLGRTADPDRQVLALAMDEVEGDTVSVPFQYGGQRLTLVVGATQPLTGELTADLPMILLVVAGSVGLLMTAVVAFTLRRRDRAEQLVADLEATNEERDRAVAEQHRADEEREAIEDDMRQMQRLEAVGQLAGGIAHDFNNLLAAILSYAELAEEDTIDHPSHDDIVEIRRAAERGADLTRQLLTFSRRDREEPDLVDLNEIVDRVVRLLARTIPADVRLDTDLAEDLPAVLADGGELEQILVNLAVNARDAVGPGGSISIETSAQVLTAEDVGVHPGMAPGPTVQLVVRDDGQGMSADVLARAFEPFFTTKERGRGTGLGLSTVYGIIQRWGGHITAQSHPGDGTAFIIMLPASSAPAPTPAIAAPVAVPGAGQTVLIAEDEDAVRRAVHRHLVAAGYQVLEAGHATGAELMAREHTIDLLLTDLVMPGRRTGVDLAEALTTLHPGLPVIFMTGYSGDTTGDPRRDEHAIILRKPFTTQALMEAVQQAFERAPSVSR
jgi:signal transduction histidine kinase